MWKLTVADKARLHRVKLHMIRIGYGVRLVNRVLTDVLWNEVGVIVKIEDNNAKLSGHAVFSI